MTRRDSRGSSTRQGRFWSLWTTYVKRCMCETGARVRMRHIAPSRPGGAGLLSDVTVPATPSPSQPNDGLTPARQDRRASHARRQAPPTAKSPRTPESIAVLASADRDLFSWLYLLPRGVSSPTRDAGVIVSVPSPDPKNNQYFLPTTTARSARS